VSGDLEGKVSVFDLQSGRNLAEAQGHAERVNAVCITADGHRAVTSGKDGTVRIWGVDPWDETAVLDGHFGAINALLLSACGDRIVSGGADGTVRLWDLASATAVATCKGHVGEVTSLCYAGDGNRLVSAGEDGSLRLWDSSTGKELKTLVGHHGPVNVVRRGGADRVVSAGADTTVRIWDLNVGSCLMTLEGHRHYVTAVCVTPDGRRAISVSDPWPLEVEPQEHDHSLLFWDLTDGRLHARSPGHTDRVRSLTLTPEHRSVISLSCDRTVRAWDVQTGRLLAVHPVADTIRAITIAPSGQIICKDSEGEVEVFVLEDLG
jgi:WD40 repeat protein